MPFTKGKNPKSKTRSKKPWKTGFKPKRLFTGQEISNSRMPKSISRSLTVAPFSTSSFNYEQSICATTIQNIPTVYDPSGSTALQLGTVTNDQNGIQFPMTYTFYIGDACNSSTKLSIFDQYRIRKCEVEIVYSADQGNINGGGDAGGNQQNAYPDLWVKPDFDDIAMPANENYMRNSQDTKLFHLMPGKSAKFTISPKPLLQVYNTALSPGYKVGKSTDWIDSVNSEVSYYGLKLWCSNFPCPASSATKIASQLKFFVKYFVEYRGVVG